MALATQRRRRRTRRKPGALRATGKDAGYVMYVLESSDGRRTYVGITNNLGRRLRQHNGELCGGARATAGRVWRVARVVGGFVSKSAALSVEKTMHNKGRRLPRCARRSVLECRIACLESTLASADASKFALGHPTVFCPQP
jgi:structure-specific endonuclease subunit SLX1